MAEWWSIEVFHGEKLPASRWKDAYEDELTEAAVTNGALYWEWHEFQYGVIFEVCFRDEEQWDAFLMLPSVRAALDGVPDPVNGLLVYKGRGGAAGPRVPRKPKPAPGAAALELEEPRKRRRIRLKYRAGDLDRLQEELGTEPPAPPAPPAPPTGPEPAEPTRADPARRGAAARHSAAPG